MTLLMHLRNVFLGSTLFSFVMAKTLAANGASITAQPKKPERIVSLSLASDEILIELLPHCGGLKRLQALSIFADDPLLSNIRDSAKQIPQRVHSEPESLFKLKPDLVIAASFNRSELLEAVKARNINILTLQGFSNAADIERHIYEIGSLIQCEMPASRMASAFLKVLDENKPQFKQKPTLLSYSPDLSVMAKDTLFDDLVEKSGGINAASVRNLKLWPRIDTETLLTLKPDFIVIVGADTPEKRNEIRNHSSWKRLKAVQQNQLIFLGSRTALSTSHYFAEAVRELRLQLRSRHISERIQ